MIIASLLLASQAQQEIAPQTLPAVQLTNMNNQEVNLHKFLGKKLVIFNWASW